MPSTTELRARIAGLSSAIDLQKQILLDLETTRANARRELNATCDPMARLPFELSSDIFTLCLPDQPGLECGTAPLIFLSICHSWSDITRSTASLWSTIHCNNTDRAHLEIWLSRAQNLPLELSLSGLSSEVVSVVKCHAGQVQRLDLRVEYADADHLQQMTTCTVLPALEKLKVGGRCYYDGYFEICLAALRAAPALVECDLLGVYDPTDAIPPFTHPCLRHLRLGINRTRIDEADDAEGGAGILKFLTLPALETLFIGVLDIPEDDLRDFFARSSPPLQSLQLGTTDGNLDIEFLHSVPTLTSLTLDFLPFDIYDLPTIAMLATAHSFLPNLRNLAIRGWASSLCQDINLIPMLVARRTRLQSVEIISQDMDEPDEYTVAMLRNLVEEDGIRVHVGTHEENYVWLPMHV
ncbi:hypothetical protein DFH06DRAFT_769934 [Mycena polygramma]|nr:hypothetical protein DFH06DRAFT_769934 [Mycena polygramma]